MKIPVILASVAMLCCTAPAFATLTAQELEKRCSVSTQSASSTSDSKKAFNDGYMLGFCRAYVASFLDTVALNNAIIERRHGIKVRRLYCFAASGIPLSRAIEVATTYMKNNPQELNKSARSVLYKAFMRSYPCANQPSSKRNMNAPRSL